MDIGQFIIRRILPVSLFCTLALILSVVFVVDDNLWQGIITAKYFWFVATLCIAVLFWTIVVVLKISIPITTCCLTDVLALLFAVFVIINFGMLNTCPNMHWWLFLQMIPLYLVCRTVCADQQLKRWLLDAVLVVVLVEAIWGLLQLYGFTRSYHSLYKITGSLFNPGPYSGFVATGVPLALSYILDKGIRKWERWFGMVTLTTAMLVLPATMSRAAWLAAILGSVPVLWKYSRFQIRSWLKGKTHRIAIVISCTIGIGLLTGLYFLKKDSVNGRLLIWKVSADMVKEHPLFGTGYGRFSAVYGDAQAKFFLDGKGTNAQTMVADSIEYAFNEYVQIAVELGLIGLVLFWILIGSVFIVEANNGSRNSRFKHIPNCYYILPLLIFATFSYPFSVLPLCVLFVFLLVISASSSPKLSFELPAWLRVVGVMICLGITGHGAYHILLKRTAYLEWTSLQVLYNTGEYSEATKRYQVLYPSLNHEKQFLFEYGQCLAKTEQYEESNRVFEQFLCYSSDPMIYNCMGNNFKEMNNYLKAEAAYICASHIVPNRHYPLYLLMMLYHETGQNVKARETAQTLLSKPVKVMSTAIHEMQEEAMRVIIDN